MIVIRQYSEKDREQFIIELWKTCDLTRINPWNDPNKDFDR